MASFRIDNQPERLRVNDFRSISSMYNGLGKSSRFIVRIQPSGINSKLTRFRNIMPELQYLCESAELPGRGFMHIDLSYHGPKFKVPYMTEYQETAMTFLCRTDSYERQLFDDWMEIINPTNTFDFDYKDSYKAEMHMYQFGEAGRRTTTEPNRETSVTSPTSNEFTEPVATYAWTLHDAFPVLVNPQPVTWADDNFQRLAISFTFSKWTRKNKDKDSGIYPIMRGRLSSIPGAGR